MDKYIGDYGFPTDDSARDFHKTRRMFCINNDKIYIAEPQSVLSHAEWFEKMGWIDKNDKSIMDKIIRGIVDDKGDVYFYMGWDFKITEEAENIFFKNIHVIKERLNLSNNTDIFGGFIVGSSDQKWLPRKSYGKIINFLNNNL